VVGVGGGEMDEVLGGEVVDCGLSFVVAVLLFGVEAGVSDEAGVVDLGEDAAGVDPLGEGFGEALVFHRALGVGEDGLEAKDLDVEQDLVEGFVATSKDGGELDQDVVALGQGDLIAPGVVSQDVEGGGGDLEFGALVEHEGQVFGGEPGGELGLDGGAFFKVRIEGCRGLAVLGREVGGADDVGDALGDVVAGELLGGGKVGGAVIEAGQDVAVDLDHVRSVLFRGQVLGGAVEIKVRAADEI